MNIHPLSPPGPGLPGGQLRSAADPRHSQHRDVFLQAAARDGERVLRTIADFCPAFGIVGSVAGLIPTPPGGIGETGVILKTVPLALTSILYGLILANFFFVPFASTCANGPTMNCCCRKIIMRKGSSPLRANSTPPSNSRPSCSPSSLLRPQGRPGAAGQNPGTLPHPRGRSLRTVCDLAVPAPASTEIPGKMGPAVYYTASPRCLPCYPLSANYLFSLFS